MSASSTAWLRRARTLALACCIAAALGAGAQEATPPRSAQQWLQRLRQMPPPPSYVGIFVVSDAAGGMSSARIWHVREGEQRIERVEALTGAQRLTYRHGQSVATFWPHKRLVRLQERGAQPLFPARLQPGAGFALDEHYEAHAQAPERVAGLEADVLLLRPRDAWRFGYRIWSERQTGLILQTQTLGERGQVLEQGGFSELQWRAPAPFAEVLHAMQDTSGWRVARRPRSARADAHAEGWRLRQGVPGFQPLNFYLRQRSEAHTMAQWMFSDGLATVSLFIEPADTKPRAARGFSGHGATHALTAHVSDAAGRMWRVTAIGEAPPRTLEALAQNLERTPPQSQAK